MMAVKTTGMSLSGGAAALATFALAALCAFGDNPPPCNPQPVVKPVKVVRREIKVAIIGEERMFKPQRRIYDLMRDRIGLHSDELCFVDDVESNCEGARRCGWHAIRFEDNAQAERDFMERFG